MTAAQNLAVDPVYRDHISAIRCALNVSAKSMGHAVSKWQNDYQSGWRVSSSGNDMSRNERFVQDCMTRHLLHSNMTPEEWAVLVIRFAPATHFHGKPVADAAEFAEMERAFTTAAAAMPSDLGQMFTGWCLMRWARRMPAGRGQWQEWYGKTDLGERTIRQRGYDIYKVANHIEAKAKQRAEQLCKAAQLTC